MTVPKFRAYGRKGYRMSTEIEPKEMYYDVSVVTTFDKKELHVIVDFGMWNEEEYDGTELIDYDLMQSTGLKDKNGVEIFEGDVLKNKDIPDTVLICEKSDLQASFRAKSKNGIISISFWYDESSDWKVIGNIHENPDLLEELNGG
ncbi:YopX family protein [Streptococcus pluranimalium]|uniref:YopX family protein n=1 Tax=Streptococcus pluranimalium TaxID=82348 RepID=UPI003F6716D6